MDPREWLFDKRVVRRNLDRGVLTMKSLREYQKTLPDLEGEFEEIDLKGLAGDGDAAPQEDAKDAAADEEA